MKASIALLLPLFFFSSASQAAIPTGMTVNLQPIVGYSFEKKSNPDRKERVFIYGARVTAGYRILSAEGEYTRGNSDAEYTAIDLHIKELSEKARVGIRSTYDLASLLSFTLRGGGEANRTTTERTTAGVTTKSQSPTNLDPYLGAGLGIHLGPVISLNAEAVATIKDVHDLKKNEYTTTIGFTLSIL